MLPCHYLLISAECLARCFVGGRVGVIMGMCTHTEENVIIWRVVKLRPYIIGQV